MSASRHKRGGAHIEEEHDSEERWLVSYADMMTLLFCLFMVLFAISSVNTSKFESLQRSLQDAFSGAVLSGGKAIAASGSSDSKSPSPPQPPLPSLRPMVAINDSSAKSDAERAAKAKQEQQAFKGLKRRIEKLAKDAGLAGKVAVTIRRRGLVIQLLTDKLFFDSGQAALKPTARHLVDKIAVLIGDERKHPVVIEGHTDSQPISGSQYPSNWELSGARAAAVVRDFASNGVLDRRLSLAGFAAQEPIATNSTAEGRSRNRRVEVVLSRIHTTDTES